MFSFQSNCGGVVDNPRMADQDVAAMVAPLLALPRETRSLEFKAAREQYSYDRLLEYCAALANERGGRIILGVTDQPPRTVCGTRAFPHPQDLERKLHEKLALRITVEECWLEGKRIVVVTVGSRPVGQAVHVDGRYLMRQGESLVPMTPDHLRAILSETTEPFLSRPVCNPLPATRVHEIIDTAAYFRLADIATPENPEDQCRRLATRRFLIRHDDGSYAPTGLGSALFAHRLDDIPELRHRRLRFVEYRGKDRTDARRDLITSGGYAIEFERFLELVNSAVPVDERIHAAHRQTVPMYASVALRELVANAIVHQDFESTPSLVVVELYEDRLEVTNPGLPLMDTRRFVEDTRPRNPDFAMVMREMGMCEARGSGIQRALVANEETGAADPSFHEGDGLTKATLIGKHDFTTMSTHERTWAVFMHACRLYAARSAMTNSTFRKRYALPPGRSSLVSLAIQQTVDEGLIRPQDAESTSKRYARYLPFYAD